MEHLARDRGEIRHKAVLARRVEKHRVGPGHRRGAVVDEVVRVGHQDDRPGATLVARHHEARQQVEPLLGAGQGQDVMVGIDGAGCEPIAAPQPIGDRPAQLGGAGHRRILVPLMGMGRQRLRQQGRRLMLRLAQ